MANGILEFEKPLLELENKINELRTFSEEKKIDLTEEIEVLEQKAEEMRENIYGNLSAWGKLQIARHPQRPKIV